MRLQEAHCFVLPTWYINEGQPVSIIESLALGKVIISTEYRAIPDMLLEGYNGFFVMRNSPEEIADRVGYLYQNPTEITRMSQNSFAIYQQGFTTEKHLSRLIAVLLEDSSQI